MSTTNATQAYPLSCTLETCPLSDAYILYLPNVGGNAFYLSLFAIMLAVQTALGIRCRTWSFLVSMVVGLILEIIGYIGRFLLHANPFNFNSFILSLVCLTLAPALFSAAIYLCFRRIILTYDESLSRIKPSAYTVIFITSDCLCLALQAAGGAITSSSKGTWPPSAMFQTGINIMIAGLSLQVVSLVVFIACCLDFMWRLYVKGKIGGQADTIFARGGRWNGFLMGLAAATVTILVRSIFRVAELKGGFGSPLANNQVAFMILEGAMIVIACVCLTVLHPGLCLQRPWSVSSKSTESDSSTSQEYGETNSTQPMSEKQKGLGQWLRIVSGRSLTRGAVEERVAN